MNGSGCVLLIIGYERIYGLAVGYPLSGRCRIGVDKIHQGYIVVCLVGVNNLGIRILNNVDLKGLRIDPEHCKIGKSLIIGRKTLHRILYSAAQRLY